MKIEKLDHYGRGICFIDGKICFVKNGLEDELCEVEIIKENKKFIEAEAKQIKNFNNCRENPKCKYYNICGGCSIMHMKNDYQTKFKLEKVENILRKFLKKDISIDKIYHLNNYNYRNKTVLHVNKEKLGFYKDKSNELVDISYCYLLDEKINDLIKYLRVYIQTEKNIKKFTIKLGNDTNEIMLIVEGKINDYSYLLDKVDVLYINEKLVTEKEYILSYIGNKKYKVSKNSFFQVNKDVTFQLYNKVLETVKRIDSKNVLDLYCGTGTIGIYIADYVDKVIGIEVVKDAVLDANYNKDLNKLDNIEFILGKVENNTNVINKNIDTVIFDPPRSGLDQKVIKIIKEIKPQNIIYISCDPITLGRDLELLSSEYNIEKIDLFDMFPNTYHVECMTVLHRKKFEK